MIQRSLTAEEFSRQRADLPNAGQWSELIRGVPVSLDPPDLDHGTIVLNLSKAFAGYVQQWEHGYPCFDLGLKVEGRPDTVLFPAVSYFLSGPRFAETDNEYTDTVPALVVELLTTGDRRRSIHERVNLYLRQGVQNVWLVDPRGVLVHLLTGSQGTPRKLDRDDVLTGEPLLPGFSIAVADLFVEPSWSR